MATAKKTANKPRATRPMRARARPRPEPEPPVTAAELVPTEPPVPLSVPEPTLAARVEPPRERPLPTSRRAIFFDVENTSRAEHISRVIAHLNVDRGDRRTEFFAVGNWRVIGHDTARLLARHGAQLVHSAPSVGVRDWSDLRIAVASGVWLASARAHDVIEIVSDDRAFDAVGDVAASLGVAFRRLSYRGLLGLPAADVPEREVEAEPSHARHGGGRSRRGRRGRRHGRPEHVARPAPVPAVGASVSDHAAGEPHTAPHDEIVAVVRELAQSSSGRNVTLDSLANALKARGFSRPPGSPRLITRLRRIKELEVSRSGVITLHDGSAPRAAAPAEVDTVDTTPEPEPPSAIEEPSVAPSAEVEEAEVIEPGNDRRYPAYEPRRNDGGQERRRSRRGGRRRRGGRGGGGGGGGGGGRPPMGDQRQPPREPPARDAAAREAAVREAFRTRTAPSYITGEPLA